MVVRNDINVNNDLNPRVAFIDAPSVLVNIQDMHDSLRKREELLVASIHPPYVSSGGKETVETGVFVGITATGQNVVIGFVGRKTFATAGTITTADTTGRNLIDSGASFVGVVNPGAWIINLTDGSVCSALTVTANQIVTDFLDGGFGSTNQWGLGDAYRILNVEQCVINGGNWVSLDESGVSIPPIFPTVGTQVILTGSTSATLLSQSQGDIDALADAVWAEDISSNANLLTESGGMLNFLRQMATNRMQESFGNPGLTELYDDADAAIIRRWEFRDVSGNKIIAAIGASARRARSTAGP